jgi:hypothetical protein
MFFNLTHSGAVSLNSVNFEVNFPTDDFTLSINSGQGRSSGNSSSIASSCLLINETHQTTFAAPGKYPARGIMESPLSNAPTQYRLDRSKPTAPVAAAIPAGPGSKDAQPNSVETKRLSKFFNNCSVLSTKVCGGRFSGSLTSEIAVEQGSSFKSPSFDLEWSLVSVGAFTHTACFVVVT